MEGSRLEKCKYCISLSFFFLLADNSHIHGKLNCLNSRVLNTDPLDFPTFSLLESEKFLKNNTRSGPVIVARGGEKMMAAKDEGIVNCNG